MIFLCFHKKTFYFFIIFRWGTAESGTAFVLYEDIFNAKNACEYFSRFIVCGCYLVFLYYQVSLRFKFNLIYESV